jgi:hypothetical protein
LSSKIEVHLFISDFPATATATATVAVAVAAAQ